MIPAMLVLDIFPDFRFDTIPLDTNPFSRDIQFVDLQFFEKYNVGK